MKLTLKLLTWKIWWAPNNASKWRMGFNSSFKGLITRMWVENTASLSPQRHSVVMLLCRILKNPFQMFTFAIVYALLQNVKRTKCRLNNVNLFFKIFLIFWAPPPPEFTTMLTRSRHRCPYRASCLGSTPSCLVRLLLSRVCFPRFSLQFYMNF
jgi:hypothetical protein